MERDRSEIKGDVASWRDWRTFAAAHGVTVTGLLEALGEAFGRDAKRIDVAALVSRAREVDSDRRRRG